MPPVDQVGFALPVQRRLLSAARPRRLGSILQRNAAATNPPRKLFTLCGRYFRLE
jgi:hypothetical protein